MSGTLKINGQVRDEKLFRKLSCYIMQEDKIQPMLTLNEVMMFAAELKLSNGTLTKEKQMIVSIVLFVLHTLCIHSSSFVLNDITASVIPIVDIRL